MVVDIKTWFTGQTPDQPVRGPRETNWDGYFNSFYGTHNPGSLYEGTQWPQEIRQNAESYYLIGNFLGVKVDNSYKQWDPILPGAATYAPADETAKDAMFAPLGVTYQNPDYIANGDPSQGKPSFPKFAFERDNTGNTTGRLYSTWFSMDPNWGYARWDPNYVHDADVARTKWKALADESTNFQDGTPSGYRSEYGQKYGIPFAWMVNALQTGNLQLWNSTNKQNQDQGFAALADGGVDTINWGIQSIKPPDSSHVLDQNPYPFTHSEPHMWFVPLTGANQYSAESVPAEYGSYNDTGALADCKLNSFNLTKCNNFMNWFYNQPAINATNCSAATSNWDKMLGINRSSAVDGLESPRAPQAGHFFSVTTDSLPVTPACWPDPSVSDGSQYICQGFSFYPLSIDGISTTDPGGGGPNGIEWIDPNTLTRNIKVSTDKSACFLNDITFYDGTPTKKWSSGCPRVQPEAFVDPSCSGATITCPNTPILQNGVIADYPEAKSWYDALWNGTVLPQATLYFGDDKNGLDNYITEKSPWVNYLVIYCAAHADQGDTAIQTEYCLPKYFLEWFQPVNVNLQVVDVNWWAAWNAIGLTKTHITEMLVGAVPVSYLCYKTDNVFLLPLYFIGSLLYFVASTGTNTGIWDTLANIEARFKSLYAKIITIMNMTGDAVKDAQKWITHIFTYLAIAGVGFGLTFLAVYNTGSFIPQGFSVEGDEFIIGTLLTLLAEFIYSLFNGDFVSLVKMITSKTGKGIFDQISDAFNFAFNIV